MNTFYDLLKFFHVLSFVFMSVPLFNLIVVNERAVLGSSFNYHADRYMENIIRRGAYRCFVFQASAFVTGVFLLMFGPLGIETLWTNWVMVLKTVFLFALTGLLSYVHFRLQPKIESFIADLGPDSEVPDDIVSQLKPYRVRRKRMATFCLFLVITIIILGLQAYDTFNPIVTLVLVGLAGLFAWRVNKTLILFGWI
jgi:hypothetical protein